MSIRGKDTWRMITFCDIPCSDFTSAQPTIHRPEDRWEVRQTRPAGVTVLGRDVIFLAQFVSEDAALNCAKSLVTADGTEVKVTKIESELPK